MIIQFVPSKKTGETIVPPPVAVAWYVGVKASVTYAISHCVPAGSVATVYPFNRTVEPNIIFPQK